MQPVRNIGIIGRITMLEGARKQVFHVLLLAAVFLILGSTLLARFDQHVQRKMLADLCVFCMFLLGSVIAITLTVTGVPAEIEQRTVYPTLAKPVRRWEFILGKFAGAMGTVAISLAIMGATFALLEWFYIGHLDTAVFYVIPFLFLETGILAGMALCLSTRMSWPLAWFLSVLFYLLGNEKFQLYTSLTAQNRGPGDRALIDVLYHLLPNLESFNFKDALVHHLQVPGAYLWQTAIYGLCYTAALLTLASLSFARREL